MTASPSINNEAFSTAMLKAPEQHVTNSAPNLNSLGALRQASSSLTTGAEEIRRAVKLLFRPEDVVEVRALGFDGSRRVGRFTPGWSLVRAIEAEDAAGRDCYWVLNPTSLPPASMADNAPGTKEADIPCRRHFLLDFDPVRQHKIATENHFQAALKQARQAAAFLENELSVVPVLASSGNGVHLLVPIDNLPNDEQSKDFIKKTQKVVAAKFSTPEVEVECFSDAARLVRIYGTVNKKTAETAELRWRRSGILDSAGVPGHQGTRTSLSLQHLDEFVRKYPLSPEPLSSGRESATGEGAVDEDALSVLLDKLHERGEPEDMLTVKDLTITSLHPTLQALMAHLWQGPESREEVSEIARRVGELYGHRPPEKKDVEDFADWLERNGSEPCFCQACEDACGRSSFTDEEYPYFVSQTAEGLKELIKGRLYDEREKKKAAAAAEHAPNNWRVLFHSYDETMNAPPLKFAIEGFLQEDGITYFGGLAGHGKTLIMLNAVKSLLEDTPLFGHDKFKVTSPSKRVLYLVPESGLGPFVHRLKLFGLTEHVRDGRLFYRTMTAPEQNAGLIDPRILKAAEGADVFLDTAIRFMEGDENSASDNRAFAKMLFRLQAAGARTIVGAHHSPKGFESRESITLENALRGSGDVGAMLCTAWAIKQNDSKTTRIHIQNVKARDFEPCDPFEIQGRPYIDQFQSFRMVTSPGLVVTSPKPPKPEKPIIAAARKLRQEGKTHEYIAQTLSVSVRTVENWQANGQLGHLTMVENAS